MGLRDAGYEHRRKKYLSAVTKRILIGGLIGALIGIIIGNTLFDEYDVEAIRNVAAFTMSGITVAQMHNPKIYLIPSILLGSICAAIGIEFPGKVIDINSFTTLMTVIAVSMAMCGAVVGNVIVEFLFDTKVLR